MEILMVDDESELLNQAEIFLKKIDERFNIDTVTSPEKALERMEEKDYDVIVSDYQMPDIDGLEFLKIVRGEKERNIPFIMFTGKGREEVAMKALNLGANRYLQKGGDPRSQYGVLSQAIYQEVTHRRTEKRLELTKYSVDKASAGIFWIDSDGRFVYVNDTIVERLSYTKDELLDMHVWDIDPNYPKEKRERFWNELKKGGSVRIETTHRTKDGDVYPVEVHSNYIEHRDRELEFAYVEDISGKIEKEEQLKESKNWLSQIVEGSSVPMFVLDEEHRVTHWNKACENLSGIKRGDIVGTKDPWKAFYEKKRPVMADLVLNEASEEEIEEWYGDKFFKSTLDEAYEVEAFFPDMGEDGKWLFFTAAPLANSDGEKVGAVETLQDITERRETEEKLKKRMSAIEASIDGIAILDENEVYTYLNEKHAEIYGYGSPEELIGKTWRILYDEEEQKRFENEIMPMIIEGGEWRGEATGMKRDGTKFPQELSLTGLEDEGLICIVRDITEKRKAKRRLQENKKKVERIHEVSSRLQNYKSEEEVYGFTIEAAEKILDFDICTILVPEEGRMMDLLTSSRFPDDASPETNQIPLDHSKAGRTYKEGRSFLTRDFSNDDEVNPTDERFRSGISVPIGRFGVFQAVSYEVDHFGDEDLKMTELLMDHIVEALKRVEMEERQNFLHSLLRHDVGNKSQIVKGYLQLIEDHDVPDEVEEYIDEAEKAINNSINIIQKVRTLKKVERKDDIDEVNIKLEIDKVLSAYETHLNENDITIEVEQCGCIVKGGILLEEMFSNFIENSIRHSDCTKIRISCRYEGDECIVTVEDDGEGISDDVKAKVFDKGFREGVNSGTGLGLYMVKVITESYGGDVEVKDSSLGGARFEVHLKKIEGK